MDRGPYVIVVLTPGTDGVYNGLPPGTTVDNFMEELEKKYNLIAKTQSQLLSLIQDATVYAVGSDDLMWMGMIKVYTEWHVYPGQSIQTAINDAGYDDIIYVHSGTYKEHVNVNKGVTLMGIGKPVVDASNSGSAITLTANGITLDGFTVINASSMPHIGIYVSSNSNVVINCTASNNFIGIWLDSSSNNILMGNIASNSTDRGIYLYDSSNNSLTDNTANSNNFFGIILDSSSENNLTGNIVSNNEQGIYLATSSNNNNLTGNIASNNEQGIMLRSSSNYNTLTDNTANSNEQEGIYLYSSCNNILMGNIANSNNEYGINLYSSSNNTLTDNTASNNSDYGIFCWQFSSTNLIYNNYFNNTNNAWDDGNNIWNIPKTEGMNIIGGPNRGGNYWSDYEGIDTNADGLGDTLRPYNSSGGIQNNGDWLPLVIHPLPTAIIDSIEPNPAKQGKDTVSFIGHGNDSYGSIIAYNWTSSIDGLLNTSSSFTKPASELSVGTHTIYFKVQDDYGTWSSAATEILTITTNQPPIASFSYSPVNPAVNETVTFNASASYDPDGNITSYNWSFGDGNIADTTTEAIITHSYASVGEYTVNLTLTDNEGATNRTSKTIKVFSNLTYFDTEAGTYPSIAGIHNGTITMTHTVNVSKIFLYPCTGTGGHVEYAKIWNSSWEGAEARWNGYIGDWHNLTFDKNFTLVAGEKYNYTIRTGSYPQIHHTPELLTAKGWITCTSFVDVNGKRHENWIPAIRLS